MGSLNQHRLTRRLHVLLLEVEFGFVLPFYAIPSAPMAEAALVQWQLLVRRQFAILVAVPAAASFTGAGWVTRCPRDPASSTYSPTSLRPVTASRFWK
jgi:hypothetical protein